MRAIGLAVVFLLLACGKSEAPEAAGVELDRDLVTLTETGASAAVGARAFDAERRTVEGVAIRWWSSNPSVANVSADGVVRAVGDGVARIWASVGGDSVFAVVVVELRGPEVRFSILPSVVRFDAIGDTAHFAFQPVGETPDSVIPRDSLESYCASIDGAIASIEQGGIVTARANGITRVRCQIGTALESLRVEVKQRARRVAIIAERDMSVRLIGDSLPLILARVDRLGEPIHDARPNWITVDPEVLEVDPVTGTVTGRMLGEGRVVAELHGLVDTAIIRVRATDAPPPEFRVPARVVTRRPRRGRPLRGGRVVVLEEGRTPFVTGRDFLPADSVILPMAQVVSALPTRPFQFSALVWQAEHRVDIGFGTDQTSGLMFGVGFGYTPGRFQVDGRILTGKLTSDSAGVEDRTVNDAQIDLAYAALPWLDLMAGLGLRSYVTGFNSERWTTLHVGGRARLDLMEGKVRAVFAGALLPVVSLDAGGVGAAESADIGLVADAGVEYRTGRFTSGLYYRLERFDFPATALFDRQEQFTALRFRVALEVGR